MPTLEHHDLLEVRRIILLAQHLRIIIYIVSFYIMENRPSFRSNELYSPDIGQQKRMTPNQDLCSPKFTRKRVEPANMFTRKPEKVSDAGEYIHYISPKKYLEQQQSASESVRSYTSINSFSRYEKPGKEAQGGTGTQPERDSISTISISDLKTADIKVFERAEQIRSKVRANQGLNQLKNANQCLNKKINELNERIKNLKEENSYLFRKIEGFTEVVAEKNAIIDHFSTLLKQKQQVLSACEQELHHQRKKSEEQENVIILLNKSLQENCQTCCCPSPADDTDDGTKQEIEQYKLQIEELSSKLKYSEIQTSMYQKLRYDLNLQLQKNESLRIHNKKLIARIEYLVACGAKENDTGKKRDSFLYADRSRRESEISLQLSPEK